MIFCLSFNIYWSIKHNKQTSRYVILKNSKSMCYTVFFFCVLLLIHIKLNKVREKKILEYDRRGIEPIIKN